MSLQGKKNNFSEQFIQHMEIELDSPNYNLPMAQDSELAKSGQPGLSGGYCNKVLTGEAQGCQERPLLSRHVEDHGANLHRPNQL